MTTSNPPVPDRGINRVVVAVWDLDAGMRFFEELLGAEFAPESDDGQAASFGVRVAMAWEAGVELVAPIPDVASAIRDELEANGEGVKGVVFAVADADVAGERAASLGLPTYYSLDFDQETIDRKCEGRFTTFKEHFVTASAPLDGTVLLGQFVRRPT
ncbi:MAG: VOC family protein [Actinomycetota bacterium]